MVDAQRSSPTLVSGSFFANRTSRFFATLAVACLSLACGDTATAPEASPSPEPLLDVVPQSAIRINAGGVGYTDVNGNFFAAQQEYVAGSFGSVEGVDGALTPFPVAGTSDDELYLSLHSSNHQTTLPFSYLFDVPNGDYEVVLHFMEPFFEPGNARQRFFDVVVEGVLELDDLNPAVEAGDERTALQVTLYTAVTDGRLDVDFVPQSVELYNTVPIVSAIEVIPTTAPVPCPDPEVACPDIAVSPPGSPEQVAGLVDFESVEIGSSTDLVVTVQNTGTVDLNVSSLVAAPAVFTMVAPATPFTVATGGSTDVTLRYSPTAERADTGSVDISSNDPDEPTVSLTLLGNGILSVAPTIEVTPSSVSFGTIPTGSTSDRLITVANTGTADLNVTDLTMTNGAFSVVGSTVPFTVAAGESADVTVRFSPTTEQSEAGDLQISSDDLQTPVLTVAMTGAGGPLPEAWRLNGNGGDYTTTTGLFFVGDRPYAAGSFGWEGGSMGDLGNPVANTDDDLLYSGVHGGRAEFAAIFDVPNGSYEVILHFNEIWHTAPNRRVFDVSLEGSVALSNYDIFVAAGGTNTATQETLSVVVSDGQLNVDFASGTAAIVSAIEVIAAEPPPPEPAIAVSPSSLAYGSVVVGSSADLTVSVDNTGTATLDVTALSTTNATFSVVGPAVPFSVPAGGSTNITVRFSPTAQQPESGDLQISSNDPAQPLATVALSGTGEAEPPPPEPAIAVSPSSLAYGSVVVGSSADLTVSVDNTGTATLDVTALSTTNATFSVVGPAVPFSVPAGGSTNITVRFSPTAQQPESGDLQISSNDPAQPLATVALSGTGEAEPLAWRLNGNGGDYTTIAGLLFEGDRQYVVGSFGWVGGSMNDLGDPVANTDDDVLYSGIHGAPSFGAAFDVPNGTYDVILHLNEIWHTGPNRRLFDVVAENVLVLEDYDIYATAGGKNVATQETFVVTVSDGQLTLDFSSDRAAIISAIEVIQR